MIAQKVSASEFSHSLDPRRKLMHLALSQQGKSWALMADLQFVLLSENLLEVGQFCYLIHEGRESVNEDAPGACCQQQPQADSL